MPFVFFWAGPASGLWRVALSFLLACWLAFAAIGLAGYVRVQQRRRAAGHREEPSLRSPAALSGLAVEVVAFALVWILRRPAPHQIAAGWLVTAIVLAFASILFFALAVRELGLHFRIKAVVAADHELVTTGPYSVVRHPIYASMLGLLIANVIVVGRWEVALLAVVIYLAGTVIRIRAEEGLLERRFPDELAVYRARVKACIPLVW